MALTVGVLAAMGALLLLQNKLQMKGVTRPLEPEMYIPAPLNCSGSPVPAAS
ncbi:hypothetical protein TRIUR3_15127 [Triticum urartu]|uniref:Uncharacterized protein n=1 Tax=Triticum urartu TaxID=4572 RepID=M7YQH3_TRIUA|nr:hypothetical protein TRIUR3_15127 [Triticum urartu]